MNKYQIEENEPPRRPYEYKPEEEARQQYQRSGQGFTENGFFYRLRLSATLNQTYALRSVSYDDSDTLVAFRFIRLDTDGSQILQWKLLRRFPTPTLRLGAMANVSAASYSRGVFTRNSIVALFGFLNRWNDTMATELEPLAVEVAERTIGPVGWEPGKHG